VLVASSGGRWFACASSNDHCALPLLRKPRPTGSRDCHSRGRRVLSGGACCLLGPADTRQRGVSTTLRVTRPSPPPATRRAPRATTRPALTHRPATRARATERRALHPSTVAPPRATPPSRPPLATTTPHQPRAIATVATLARRSISSSVAAHKAFRGQPARSRWAAESSPSRPWASTAEPRVAATSPVG
jgi:hypothetical protein